MNGGAVGVRYGEVDGRDRRQVTTSSGLAGAARYFGVLSDPTRLHILELLAEGDRGVSQLVRALGGSQSRVSNHLACLRWCGFVEARRSGREVIYTLADRTATTVVGLVWELVAGGRCEHLGSCTRLGQPSATE